MIRVTSEVGRLRAVVVQSPGPAHDRMLPGHIHPGSPDYLLFDDLVDVTEARREHADLVAVLRSVAEVYEVETLATEVFGHLDARKAVLDEVGTLCRLSDARAALLEGLDAAELAQTLISGTAGGSLDGEEIFPPVPNLIFTRDLAAVVGEMVVVGSARKAARLRESVLTWAIVDHHPLFAGVKVSEVAKTLRRAGRRAPFTIEGGDVLVISDTLVCIGASERTSWSMILGLAEEIFAAGFTRVLVAEMPKQRSSMHLDTVFTMVDQGACVVYGPLLKSGSPEEASMIRLARHQGRTSVEVLPGNLIHALEAEGHAMTAVRCGGGHPVYERREQWTDGSNYVALGPGVVVGYARNRYTAREMSREGFRVVDPDAFRLELDRDFNGNPDELFASGRRYAVHISGSELSRGRGGPRCLTMPLLRD